MEESKNDSMVNAEDLKITWNAKDLEITWGNDPRYWRLVNETETSPIEMLNVCWLEVSGKRENLSLSPKTPYEVVLEAEMKSSAYGWEDPVNFKFTHGGVTNDWPINLEDMFKDNKDRMKDIKLGEFNASANQRNIDFLLYKYGGKWKSGLVIKGVAVRPKSQVASDVRPKSQVASEPSCISNK